MPRQDVPYGGALCRLKERIAEIWDELGKKLHSINGVEGDAAGDVKIVSGDATVVVTSDQVNHEIEIALDSSQLPTAAVSSVNGQTGAVVLDASDINVIGGSDVATDLGNLDADLQQAQTDIATEALTRANADSALQGNINAALATIPTAAATAVANDPTVAQLATDVPNKLDKITSGNSLKAYTHTGATQGETSVVDGTAANSIGIRDANGRMQAADPASGATDKTLTTANWISQTGAGRPNNLIHDGGNENVGGNKSYDGLQIHPLQNHDYYVSSQYCRLLQFSGRMQIFFQIYTYKGTGLGVIDTTTSANEEKGGITLFDPSGWWSNGTTEFFILYNAVTSKYDVWAHSTTAVSILVQAVKTYGTARPWGYYDSLGNTQTADPRNDTTTYPNAPIVIPVQVVA